MNEEKQLEFVNTLYEKYGITDQNKKNAALSAFNQDFDLALKTFYSKYNPEKEINQEYFGKIKQDYFTVAAQPDAINPIGEVGVPQEPAPQGFFSNLKNSLDNLPEATANSFWSALNMTDRLIDNAFDIGVEAITGIPQSGEAANTAFFLDKIEKNKKSSLPTKGAISSFNEGDYGATGAAVVGTTLDFARSILSGWATMGALPIAEQAEGMYLSAVEEKAKSLGVSPLKLIADNNDDELEPMLYGALAAALEKVGLKGVDDFINSIPPSAKSNVFKWLYTNAKEGTTETAQKVLEDFNSSRASGLSLTESGSVALDKLFSEEGAETFLMGTLGSAGVAAIGQGIKRTLLTESGEIGGDNATPVEPVTPADPASPADPAQAKLSDSNAVTNGVIAAAMDESTGDASLDSEINNVIREAKDQAKSQELLEKEKVSKEESVAKAEEEVKATEKLEEVKEGAEESFMEETSKEASRTVRDKDSLKKALYTITGTDATNKDAVEQVNTFASFIDGVIGARSKREGISKKEWYLSRFAPIATKAGKEGKLETTFLDDGRALISALGASDTKSFFTQFAKVLQKDLTETESLALEAEFGINFSKDFSDESLNTFGQAFESYVKTGKVPDGIKGNTASQVKAAFAKMAQWFRDIKSSFDGESSLYVSPQVREIFDAIVTGQDIQEQTDTNVETTSEAINQGDVLSSAGDAVGNTGTTSADTGIETVKAEVVTGKPAKTIDITPANTAKTTTETKNEQKTKEASKQGVQESSKDGGPRAQIDSRKRREKAYGDFQDGFEASPSGKIVRKGSGKVAESTARKLLNSLSELALDKNLTESERKKATKDYNELKAAVEKADKAKELVANRKNTLSEVYKNAKSDNFSTSAASQLFKDENLQPLLYEDGEVAYVNMTTGETFTLNLELGTSAKEETGVFKGEKAKKRRSDAKKEIEDSVKATKEARANVEKANSMDKAMLSNGKKSTAPGLLDRILNMLKAIDLESLDAYATESDANIDSLSEGLYTLLYDLKESLRITSTNARTIESSAKSNLETIGSARAILNQQESLIKSNQQSLLESDQIDAIRKRLDEAEGDINATGEDVAFKAANKKEVLSSDLKGTVYDKNVSVQTIGVNNRNASTEEGRLARDVVGVLNSLIKLFSKNSKRKPIVLVDIDFFTNENRTEFKDKTSQQIIDLRNGARDALARVLLESSNRNTKEGGKISTQEDGLKAANSLINQMIKNDSNVAGYNAQDDFSIILYRSGKPRNETLISIAHEFGHYLQEELYDGASQEVKDAIMKDYDSWAAEISSRNAIDRSKTYFIPSVFAKNKRMVEGAEVKHFSSFKEYFAEQVSYWINTNETASGSVQKFFKTVADAIKKIFLSLKENYTVSESIGNLLSSNTDNTYRTISKDSKITKDRVKDSSVATFIEIISKKRIIEDETGMSAKLVPITKEDYQDRVKPAKKASADKVKGLQDQVNALEKDLDALFATYQGELGVMDRDAFMAEQESKAKKKIADGVVSAALERAAADMRESDADDTTSELSPFGEPAVDFQITSPNSPRSGTKREVLLERIAKFSEGRFKTMAEFKDLMKAFNKNLKVQGEPTLTTKEKREIQAMTTSGSIARVSAPIMEMFDSKRTDDLKKVIDSFSASRKERDDALAEADSMIKSGAPLTTELLDRFNKLLLVGLYNTTAKERESLIKDKVAGQVVGKEKSRITHRVEEARNNRRIILTEAFYESVYGFKQVAKGIYEGVLKGSGKKIQIRIYDRNMEYVPGDIVDHGGRIYRVTEKIDAFESGFMKKMDKIGSVNTHMSTATLAKTYKNSLTRKIRNLGLSSHGIESLTDMISVANEDGAFESSLSKMIGEDGFRKAALGVMKKNNTVEKLYLDLAQRVFGVTKSKDVAKKLFDIRSKVKTLTYKDNKGNSVSTEMTAGELMTWYAYLGQKDLVANFKVMAKDYSAMPEDIRFWNKSKQDAIIASLSKEEKDFVNGIVTEVMPYVYNFLNKAHKEHMGYDMQLIDNYFPTNVELSETDKRQTSIIDPNDINFSAFINSVGNKNIKERRSNNALKAKDFMSQFLSYSSNAAHYSEYAEPVKRASLIFENQKYEFAGYLSNVFGKDTMKNINLNLSNIANGGALHFKRQAIIDTMRGLAISGAFMANITMIPKQFSSFIALADGMSWVDFSKYYIVSGRKVAEDYKEIMSMDFVKDRIKKQGRLTYDTYGLMFDTVEKELSKTQARKGFESSMAKINSYLFAPVMLGDISAVVVGGAPLLRSLKKVAETKFPGDTARQKEWVDIKFAEKVSRSQQSSDIMDQSDIQTQGSATALLVTFLSTPILYGRLLAASLRNLSKGVKSGNKETIKKSLKTAVMYSIIAPLAFQVTSSGGELLMDALGFDDDEDEEDQKTAWKYLISQVGVSFIQHIPIVYPIVQSITDGLIKGTDFDASISPPISIVTKGVGGFKNIAEDIINDEFDIEDKSTQNDINSIARTVGINYKGMKNLGSNWAQLLTEGSVEDWRYLFGYSEYSVK